MYFGRGRRSYYKPAANFLRSKQVKRDPVAKSNKWLVTFEAPAEIKAEELAVVGDFNDWDAGSGYLPIQPSKRSILHEFSLF